MSPSQQRAVVEAYDIQLPFTSGDAQFTTFKVNQSQWNSPCYFKLSSAEDTFKISQARYDEIKVNVKSLPPNGFVIFQHSAFPSNYMEIRNRHNVTSSPETVTFKNYEKVLILLVGKGEFVLEYKREYVAPENKWRHKFNYAITIYGSLALYTLYFFIFEGKNVL